MQLTEQDLLHRDDCRLTPELVDEYYRSGDWRGVALHTYLAEAVQARPDGLAAVSYDLDLGTRRELTYSDYEAEANGVAAGLAALGIEPGDRVAVMLPNRHEFGSAVFGINRMGGVYAGIPSTYGKREVSNILTTTRARVLITQDAFRGRDHTELVASLIDEQPTLEKVVLVPESSTKASCNGPFVAWEDFLGDPTQAPVAAQAGSVCQIGFTSGTSGVPKGVMNTNQTLDYILRQWIEHVGRDTIGPNPVSLLPSPVGHHSGFLWGVLYSAYLQGTAVYMSRWNPGEAVRIVEEEQVGSLIAAPTFLQDIFQETERQDAHPTSWRVISIPGAPLPRALVPKARDRLGCFICPSWGMTEWGIGVSASPTDPLEAVDTRDGRPIGGCQVRVNDHESQSVIDEEGDLEIRGPGLFVGYFERPDAREEAFDSDGWFQTGDRALLDANGYVELKGRSKDIIIRGGENIPVAELENILYSHPEVVEVALVGYPDERLGERACAVVVQRNPEPPLSLEDVTEHLLASGVSKHYLPERVEVVSALPKTMSGKIRKVELREQLETPGPLSGR